MLKYIVCVLFRFIMRAFWIIPIDDKGVLLTSFAGRQYSCNPKYIAEYLLNNSKYKIYYVLADENYTEIPDGIKIIKYKSLKHLVYLMKCKFVIVNSSDFTKYLPYRKKQKYINTWHGAFIFKVGDKKNNESFWGKKILEICKNELSYYVRTCKYDQGPIYLRDDDNCDKWLDIGYPRNDIFWNEINKAEILKKIGVRNDVKIILYAPTYRDFYNNDQAKSIKGYGFEQLDVNSVIKHFEKRFECKHVILYRAHHNMISTNASDEAINVSEYPDMQELLAVSDYLITDYSSSMYDFALQQKPGFLYVPDLENFKWNIPEFNLIEDWPYPFAVDNNAFLELIDNYDDEKNRYKIISFQEKIDMYDMGNSNERLLEILKNI